jgi:hypothetical protein
MQTLDALINELIRDLQAAREAPTPEQAVALIAPATERLKYRKIKNSIRSVNVTSAGVGRDLSSYNSNIQIVLRSEERVFEQWAPPVPEVRGFGRVVLGNSGLGLTVLPAGVGAPISSDGPCRREAGPCRKLVL